MARKAKSKPIGYTYHDNWKMEHYNRNVSEDWYKQVFGTPVAHFCLDNTEPDHPRFQKDHPERKEFIQNFAMSKPACLYVRTRIDPEHWIGLTKGEHWFVSEDMKAIGPYIKSVMSFASNILVGDVVEYHLYENGILIKEGSEKMNKNFLKTISDN